MGSPQQVLPLQQEVARASVPAALHRAHRWSATARCWYARRDGYPFVCLARHFPGRQSVPPATLAKWRLVHSPARALADEASSLSGRETPRKSRNYPVG